MDHWNPFHEYQIHNLSKLTVGFIKIREILNKLRVTSVHHLLRNHLHLQKHRLEFFVGRTEVSRGMCI